MGRSKECTILQATLLLAAAVSAIAETNVSTSSSAQNQTQQGSNLTITTSSSALLNKGAFAVCPSAGSSSLIVCQFFASGVGSLAQRSTKGATCMPMYNCAADWNPCSRAANLAKHNRPEPLREGLSPNVPYARLDNTSVIASACAEITSLATQNTGSGSPPDGGWAPTSLGWHKGNGNVGCGWGTTYGGITPGSTLSLADYGRVEISGVSSVTECCQRAMGYEGATMAQGGKAIRFDLSGNTCRIDREVMMRGNLDSSGGLPMVYLNACGDPGETHYWRHAAGSADGASLNNAGSCAAQYAFTKVLSSNSLAPVGRIPDAGEEFGRVQSLPDGIEIPNHVGICSDPARSDYNPATCFETLRYNAINTAEGCCEVCVQNRWLPNTGDSGGTNDTKCVGFQIVGGKCRIIREKFFADRYGVSGNGYITSGAGNEPLTAFELCARGDLACNRADNSHGHWGKCSTSDTAVGNERCEFFSFMYYRDRNASTGEFPPANPGAKAVYTSFEVYEEIDISEGFNMSVNFTMVGNRGDGKNLTNAPVSSTDVSKGFTEVKEQHTNTSVNLSTCAKVVLYELEATALISIDGSTVIDPEAPVNRTAVAESNTCCASGSAAAACTMTLQRNATNQSEASGRRLLATGGAKKGFVLAYECDGSGGDACDMRVDGAPSASTAPATPSSPSSSNSSSSSSSPQSSNPSSPSSSPSSLPSSSPQSSPPSSPSSSPSPDMSESSSSPFLGATPHLLLLACACALVLC